MPRIQGPVPREAENADPLLLQYSIITAQTAPGSCSSHLFTCSICCGKTCCSQHLVNSQWVCRKKIYLWQTFYWTWKPASLGFLCDGVRTPQRVTLHLKTLISQRYTCLRHFNMEKSFFKWLWELCGLSLIRKPCGTVWFHFLHLPSFMFLSGFLAFFFKPTCFSFCFTLFPLWMSSNYNIVKKKSSQMSLVNAVILCQANGPARSATQ